MDQQRQIKIIDFRNACYQGQTQGGSFHGLGAVLTEDMLFCLASWQRGQLHGPCFVMYPNQKIFYAQFVDNRPQGLCSYEMGNECQLYCTWEAGVMGRHIVAVFGQIECLLDLKISADDRIEHMQEYDYKTSEQKWSIIERLLGFRIPPKFQKFNKFISQQFVPFYNAIEQVFGKEYFIGFVGEGIGMKVNLENLGIQSLGFYNADKRLKLMGKRIINKQRRVKEEGVYERPDTLVRYQVRPEGIKKHYRDCFRQSMNFCNSFFTLPIIASIEQELNKLKIKIKDGTTQRIAQQLIEHLDQHELNQVTEEGDPAMQSSPIKTNSRNTDRSRPTIRQNEITKMMPDVSIIELKEELNRSISHKKRADKSKSPYKNYDLSPAELKYRSRENHESRKIQNTLDNDRTPTRPLRFDEAVESTTLRNRYREITRQHQQTHILNESITKQQSRRYPIEQNLRAIQPTRSPTKDNHKIPKFMYLEQRINNPERPSEPSKSGIGSNSRRTPNQQRPISPSRGTTRHSPSKPRVDKFATMYDQIEEDDLQGESRYALNRGQGYRFTQAEDELDRQMGLVRGPRRVESPARSRSPIGYEVIHKPKYQGDREVAHKQKHQNSYPRSRESNYGYFDKNY